MEIVSLERSLIEWLQSLHLAKGSENTILDVEDRICSGVLLCELANILHKYSNKIHGILFNPKNNSGALSNIKKAFDSFRQLPKLDRRYLWRCIQLVCMMSNSVGDT